MADDKEEKTEEPTGKKLNEAMEKGEVASSQEVKTWLLFIVFTGILMTLSGYVLTSIGRSLGDFLGTMHEIRTETTGFMVPIRDLVIDVGVAVAFPIGLIIVAALLGNRMQNKFVFAVEKIKPDIKQLSPIKGIKKIFSTNSLVELLKAIVKVSIVGIVVFAIVWPERSALDSLMFRPVSGLAEFILMIVIQLFVGVTLLLTAIAAIDYAWQNYQFRKNLRMTKQEVKDERKQTDGDPRVKGRLRQIRRDRFQKRLVSLIEEADVVVTNPTHYAVALNYKHGEMDVPVVAAKGVDWIALRMREFADEFGVPIVENPPLARALYAGAEVDQEIPADQYRAVAEVISYVMKLKRAGMTGRRKPATSSASSAGAPGGADPADTGIA